MKNKLDLTIKILIVWTSFLCGHIVFANGLTSCEAFGNLKEGTSKREMYSGTLRVVRLNTPIYENKVGDIVKDKAPFNARFELSEAGKERLLVEKNGETVGWINRVDLFCGRSAIKTSSGNDSRGSLIKKLYVATGKSFYENQEERLNGIRTIPASETPFSVDKCAGGRCRQLSRFSGYYIYAEMNAKGCSSTEHNKECIQYLLGEHSNLDTNEGFVGWVRSDNAFIWNTSYGLRVSESLPSVNAKDLEKTLKNRLAKNQSICGYTTLEKIKQKKIEDCIELNGGWDWFKSPIRMYAIDKTTDGEYYKVIAPLEGQRVKLKTKKLNINFGDLKHLDIMFLVDGTQSMTSNMQKVKETVKDITSQIINDYQNYSKRSKKNRNNNIVTGMEYRFAFQVYRDSYAKEKEFGDKFLFSRSTSCNMSTNKFIHNQKIFLEKFNDALKTTKRDRGSGDRDHEENLYGGIQNAIKNLRLSCPNSLKILFVIGDTGYNGENQRNFYGRKAIPKESIAKKLKGEDGVKKSIVLYFLQTPELQESSICSNVNSPKCKSRYKKYTKAYSLFHEEATYFVNASLVNLNKRIRKSNKPEEVASPDIQPSDYILNIDIENISKIIQENISKFAQNELVNQIAMDVGSGMSLESSINRLKHHPDFMSVPSHFFELILESNCKSEDDKECKEGIIEEIKEFYIEANNRVSKDIWIDVKTFEGMKDFFSKVARYFRENSGDSLEKSNEKLKQLLVDGLVKRLGYDNVQNKTDFNTKQLKDLLSYQLGIPFNNTSALFKYTIEDYGNTEVVTKCVKNNLLDWINSYNQILNILYSQTMFPACGDVAGLREKYKNNPNYIYRNINKYYPPVCGKNQEEIKEKKIEVTIECNKLTDFYLPNPIIRGQPFKSNSMSYFYIFNDSRQSSGVKDFLWIPEQLLP